MTPVEWLIVALIALRLGLVRRHGGGLVAEAAADCTLALPVFLLQEARLFHVEAWSLWLPGGVPIFAVFFGVALLGSAVTVAGRLGETWVRVSPRMRNPWLLAAIDALVFAAFVAAGEAMLYHAGAWVYRFGGSLGTVPSLDIPWTAVAGTAGFGLFFATAIREFRRWAIDAVGRLAVPGRAVFGLGSEAPRTVLAGRVAARLGLRRALGTAVYRFLDL